jgi:hypothetical protein
VSGKAKKETLPEKSGRGQILFYQSEDGRSRIEVRVEEETVWLSQKALSDLYQVDVATINEQPRHIYEEGELDRNRTIRQFLIVRFEGARQVNREVAHVSLDAILSVGYRVRSNRGTQFRRWATERLRDFLVKGFVLDDERLKEGKNLGADYFDELLDYSQWRNFLLVVEKAKEACWKAGNEVPDHFADVSKMIEIGKRGQKWQ